MGESLKNVYTKSYIESVGQSVKKEYSLFSVTKFTNIVFDKTWPKRELKDRMYHISGAMREQLPSDFNLTAKVIQKAAEGFGGYEGMFFPGYIELFGREKKNRKIALETLEILTSFSSSEFGIRPFIIDDLLGTMKWMLKLSKSSNHHVRRFSSEGCRPRLPWAMALNELKKDPTLIIPILENLKDDPSLYVRKSVANNLNDISKDHPEIALKLAKKWVNQSERQTWIVKHGLRTLLKSSDPKALALFGYGSSKNFTLKKFSLKLKNISFGEDLEFSIQLKAIKKEKIRIEYAIYYLRKNGEYSRKVFKLTEKELEAGVHTIEKRHSFKIISTRKFYPGVQKIGVIVNGDEKEILSFKLGHPQDWYVYIIETLKATLYTGITTNLERRFEEHKNSKKGAKYFRGQKPKAIVYHEVLKSKSEALKREIYIKKLRKDKKLELIRKNE